MRSTTALAALALAGLACQPAEDPAAVTAEIRANSEAFGRQMTAGHMDSVAMWYTDDGSVLAPGMPPADGREAILAEFNAMKASGGTFALTLHTDTVHVSGPLAVERGRYTMTVTFPNGMVVPDTGKFLAQWRKTDAGWRMVNDIWNSNATPAPEQ